MKVRITDHALERYRERVNPSAGRSDMMSCLRSAKPKRLKLLEAGNRNTLIVKTGCCFFICSGSSVVSVVKEVRAKPKDELPTSSV